ncbi:MAG: hypothetical protein F9K23_12710 [Bacteroidetes bacterium]|nr:MAG: hypothetical protein F9K23_12710 [Bacteroidota bacterium]
MPHTNYSTQVLLLGYSDVFDTPPDKIDTYLSGISRTTLLSAAEHFLGFKPTNRENIYDFLSWYCSKENAEFVDQICQKIKEKEKRLNKQFKIVNPLASLKLYEYCYNQNEVVDSITNIELEQNIFKAYTLINETIDKKELSHKNKYEYLAGDEKLIAVFLTPNIAKDEFINYNLHNVNICQVIKSVLFFEFLEKEKPVLLESFINKLNAYDWKNLLRELISFTWVVLNEGRQEGRTTIQISNERNNRDWFCDFLDSFVNTFPKLSNPEKDFIELRSKPFYRMLEDFTYSITYPLFAIEQIHKGLFFKVWEEDKTLKHTKDFRSFYCDFFSEKELFYKILKSLLPNNYKKLSGEEIKQRYNIDGEPDFYSRNEDNIFIFESKDILISAEIKHSYDYEAIKSELQKKLLLNERGRRKAIIQLTDNIHNTLNKTLKYDNEYNRSKAKIYPILVLHERMFNCLGLINL